MDFGGKPYPQLRQQVMMLKPGDLGLSPEVFGKVWGVVMESGLTEGVSSLVVLGDGTINFYLSSGGSITGGAQHDGPRTAAENLLSVSGDYCQLAQPAFMFPMPEAGKTIFYFLTFDGVLSVEENEDELGNGEHALSPFFNNAQSVVTALKLIQQPDKIAEHAETSEIEGIGPLAETGDEESAAETDESEESAGSGELEDGLSHLMYAVTNGFTDKVENLLKAGVDPEESDESGMTPLMAAAFSNQEATLTQLLEAGCQVEIKDGLGYTALMFACNGGSYPCGKLLVEYGADVNATDNDLSTPLMFAAQTGNSDLVKLLMEQGADPNFIGDYGMSAIDFAEQNKFMEMAEMMRNEG